MDMNFANLYLLSQKNDFKDQLLNTKNKKIDDNELSKKLSENIEDLYKR